MNDEEKAARKQRFEQREPVYRFRLALLYLDDAQRYLDSAREHLGPAHPLYAEVRALWEQTMDLQVAVLDRGTV